MPKLWFEPESLRRGLAKAKIVKPETGDLHMRFTGTSLQIWTYDRRRQAMVFVEPMRSEGADPGWTSEEFYVSMDRSVLFDTDLKTVSISVNEKSISVHAQDDAGITRSATLKKRSESSRRQKMPVPPSLPAVRILRSDLDEALRQVSCSALIKETKSEEDMRVNQVHFHGDIGCASSNARYYASLAFMDSVPDGFSLVSSDIPPVRAFCSKCQSEWMELAQDEFRVYVRDPGTGSILSLNKVSPKRSPVAILDQSMFSVEIRADRDVLCRSLGWSSTAVEGTQRLSVAAVRDPDGDSGTMKLSSSSQELASIPIRFVSGHSLSADFPVRIMASIIGFMDGEVSMRYGHKSAPTVMEITGSSDSKVRGVHYLQSMKAR